MMLLGILVFWCNGDAEQIDRLFRQSGRMRPDKWDRSLGATTYGMFSIQKQIAVAKEFYSPIGRHPATEDFSIDFETLSILHPENNSLYSWTDIGFGRLFADYYKSIARYVPEKKIWRCYADGIWNDDIGSLRVMELCKKLADALMFYTISLENERLKKDYLDYCRKWQLRRYRETILKDAQSVYPVPISCFDCHPDLFNCANGTLNLKTGAFMEHNPEDFLTKHSNVNYDPRADCKRFETFIREITSNDIDKADFLQKAFGYGISGDTRYECLFVLYGASTRNGKGTLCESVLKVLGNYGCTTRPETISVKSNTNSGNPTEDIARLAGIRFANISEPGRGLVFNAAQVKSMTGNDTINARFLHENSFDFSPQFKLYINANYLPVIHDMTLFSSGRVVIIPFDRHFDEAEQDKTLKHQFTRPENQSAILNWLLKGYNLLMKEGLTQPQSVKDAINAYHHDSDKITLFLEDAMEENPGAEVRTSVAYTHYRQWCMENGHFSENIKNFKQALEATATVVRRRPRSGGSETTLLLGYTIRGDFL